MDKVVAAMHCAYERCCRRALRLLPVVQLAEVLRGDKQPVHPDIFLPSPHLHFGAGKLSFGLVLEAMLRSGVRDLVVVQRQSSGGNLLLERLLPPLSPRLFVTGRSALLYESARDPSVSH